MILNNSINNSTKVTIFNINGVWNKDARSSSIDVYMWTGGYGGGSGRRGVAGGGGGGGGLAGDVAFFSFPAIFFPTTANVVIGIGGLGAPSVLIDDTDGTQGGLSTSTSFGGWIVPQLNGSAAFKPGYGGYDAGGGAGGNGGGFCGNYALYSTTYAGTGGPGDVTDGWPPWNQPGNGFLYGSGGGGGGADPAHIYKGGKGGDITDYSNVTIFIDGGAGGIESGVINGADGQSVFSGYPMQGSTGSGGGGGGGQSAGAAAGNGGKGGVPGGGGGGGGASLNGTPSGAGGNGGDGMVMVVEHF